MSDKTGIEWTDATWNPTTGCDRVSPGCDNCYAMTLAPRLKAMGSPRYQTDGDPKTSGPGFGFAMHEDALAKPMEWTRPRRIFVNSMSDLFHSSMSLGFLARVWAVMSIAEQHTFQILTKRPGVMRSVLSGQVSPMPGVSMPFKMLVDVERMKMGFPVLPDSLRADGTYAWPLRNVWLGTSVEDQKRADLRIPALLETPAAVRFLSCEPLLGPVSLFANTKIDTGVLVDWVIVGGESGPGARPMHPEWARGLRAECNAYDIAFHFKQWGEWVKVDRIADAAAGDVWVLGEGGMEPVPWRPDTAGAEAHRWGPHRDQLMRRVGKKAAGRVLDGRAWDEFPQAVSS